MARSIRPLPMLRPMLMAAALGLASLAPIVVPAAVAQTLCSEPVEPICATTIPATDPSAAIDAGVARKRCLEDMDSYRDKLTEYRACLQGSVAHAERSLAAAADFARCLEDEKPECRLGRAD